MLTGEIITFLSENYDLQDLCSKFSKHVFSSKVSTALLNRVRLTGTER